jgi:signal transduction histidine kinase/CheY-like chemotaxis protein
VASVLSALLTWLFSSKLQKEVAQRTSDLRKLNDDLQAAKARLEENSRLKSEFLANMSHELRTPINGILGMTELVLDTAITAEQREYLETVKHSAESLGAIVDDILDFARIEAGKLKLVPGPIALRASLREMIEPFALRARERGVKMEADVAAEVPDALVADWGRLRQTLVNLVSNAVKFTERGEIVLAIRFASDAGRDQETRLHFSVRDTGIGIAADKQKTIFAAFTQADGSATRRYGGTGLGLAICAQLVDLMGGRIWVESEPGTGSTFHFTACLNLASATRVEGGLAPLAQALGTAPGPPQPEAPGCLALVAEDNPVNLRVAQRMLEKRGFRVIAASNGRLAVERWRREFPNLILMDLQMPEMDGLTAAREIRLAEAVLGGHVPIIALTANSMTGDREKCLEAGMDAYLSKPVDQTELMTAIERVLPRGVHASAAT